MSEMPMMIALASTGTAAIAMAAGAGLKAWQQWLEVRRAEIDRSRGPAHARPPRTDIDELRRRVRRLEAIADGAQD